MIGGEENDKLFGSREQPEQKLMPISQIIRERLQKDGKRFHANDNIAEYIHEAGEIDLLIDEVEEKFHDVLQSLVIDVENDPNSNETPRRLAKMYVKELMSGRFEPAPKVTSFPNDDPIERYKGMIVTRAEIISMCSHHHQPVKGVAYIGLLPSVRVIGLSKYVRIAQWCAKRGTLQEQLTKQIAEAIMKYTHTEDLAVYVQCTHGCMEHRGVICHSSLTQTCELHGQFYNPSVKNEFLDYIRMQQQFAGNRT